MAKKGKRQIIILACSVCKSQNYVSEKSRENTPNALVLKKYCKKCRKQTEHKEIKK